MVRIFSKKVIVVMISICLLVVSSSAHPANHPIKLAILPCTNIVMTFKKFHPLAAYLQEETGLDIRLVVPKDFPEFVSSLTSKEIDFALQDPHTYVRLAALFDGDALIKARTLEGETTQSGVVIVRKDSHITNIQDLRGKTVMFGPKFSAAKWVAAKLLFEDHGINLDKDLKAYLNGGCCEDIAFSLYLRAVDAGVVCDHFLAEHEEKQKELGVEAEQISVIAKTPTVPTRVFAARQEISKDIKMIINQALLKLDIKNPQHATILYRAELGGFQQSKHEDYDSIRMLLGETKVE